MNIFKKAWNWITNAKEAPKVIYSPFIEYAVPMMHDVAIHYLLDKNFFDSIKKHTPDALMAIDAIDKIFGEPGGCVYNSTLAVKFYGTSETIVSIIVTIERTHGRSHAVALKNVMSLSAQESFSLIIAGDPKSKEPFKLAPTYLDDVRLASIRAEKSDIDPSCNVKMVLAFNAVTSAELNKKILPSMLHKATKAAVSYGNSRKESQ